MVDVVRYANEHGMYFSDRPMPITSQARRSRAQGVFTEPNHLVASAFIDADSGVRQWIEQSKSVSFILVATAWGVCMPSMSGVPTDTPFRLGLSIYQNGVLVAEGHPPASDTPPAIGMQNDPATNLRDGYHMQYAISYAGDRVAVSDGSGGTFEARFEVYTDGGPMTIDTDLSYSFVELGLLDIVQETAGLV